MTSKKFKDALGKLLVGDLPLRTAFRLKGMNKMVVGEAEKYEAVRQDLLNKFGKKGDDGKLAVDATNNVQFEAEGIRAFMQALQELSDTDIDIPTLKIDDLGDKIELSAEDLIVLDGFIV